jgi:hypothetical protein
MSRIVYDRARRRAFPFRKLRQGHSAKHNRQVSVWRGASAGIHRTTGKLLTFALLWLDRTRKTGLYRLQPQRGLEIDRREAWGSHRCGAGFAVCLHRGVRQRLEPAWHSRRTNGDAELTPGDPGAESSGAYSSPIPGCRLLAADQTPAATMRFCALWLSQRHQVANSSAPRYLVAPALRVTAVALARNGNGAAGCCGKLAPRSASRRASVKNRRGGFANSSSCLRISPVGAVPGRVE